MPCESCLWNRRVMHDEPEAAQPKNESARSGGAPILDSLMWNIPVRLFGSTAVGLDKSSRKLARTDSGKSSVHP